MPEDALRILQVSTADIAGGAEKVAWNLFQAYRLCGHESWLAVGHRLSDDPNVILIRNEESRSKWAHFWAGIGNSFSPFVGKVRGASRLRRGLYGMAEIERYLEVRKGHEDLDFPGTWRLLDLLASCPDIVHCHNLHGAWLPTGGYFDLRALPWLSQQVPVVLTLHDAWLLSGHCAHSFDCERWKVGCGNCPDLTIYPAIRKDATAYNWKRKREISARSRLCIATPSQWLMDKVRQSMLVEGSVECCVVPSGVDLSVFRPADGRAARASLGIPQDFRVLLFTASSIRRSIWKDYQTLRTAVARVAERLTGQRVLFIALGEDASPEHIGRAEIRFIAYKRESEAVARYYQAADVYVHAARADTFPNTVIEALACGTPVVATGVGGISEQVRGFKASDSGIRISDLNEYGVNEATGFLVPVGEAEVMAEAIVFLLTNGALRKRLGENGMHDARERFDLNQQVETYLEWYRAILTCKRTRPPSLQLDNAPRGSYAQSSIR